MKIFSVARKTLRELLRDRRTVMLTLGLPIIFMLIFGFAFNTPNSTSYEVDYINHDHGTLGSTYLGILQNLTTGANSTQKLLILHNVSSEADGSANVKSRTVAIFFEIPTNFSDAIAAARGHRPASTGSSPLPGGVPIVGQNSSSPTSTAAGPNATLIIVGDPGFANYGIAAQIVQGTLASFVKKAAGEADPVQVASQSVTSSQLTAFDYIVPGLVVFSIINMVPQVAAILARETEQRTLDRMRLSLVGVFDLLGGVSMAQLVMSAMALLLMFGTANLMGFHNQGTIVDALVVSIITVFCILGVGMIVAAFALKQQDAANIGVLISIPASFLSGAFFPIPALNIVTIGSTTYQLYDILPTTHAVRALRSTMTLGEGLGDVQNELMALVVLGLAFFVIGAFLYTNRRLRPE
ncbi:MAG: ABC transporter permease [Thermoplasmatota archaeon]